MGLRKLTVRFEEPFWIGLVETEDGGTHRAEQEIAERGEYSWTADIRAHNMN